MDNDCIISPYILKRSKVTSENLKSWQWKYKNEVTEQYSDLVEKKHNELVKQQAADLSGKNEAIGQILAKDIRIRNMSHDAMELAIDRIKTLIPIETDLTRLSNCLKALHDVVSDSHKESETPASNWIMNFVLPMQIREKDKEDETIDINSFNPNNKLHYAEEIN